MDFCSVCMLQNPPTCMPLHVDVGGADGMMARQGGAGALNPSREGFTAAIPAAQGKAPTASQDGQGVSMPGPSGPGLLACAMPAPVKREPGELIREGSYLLSSRDPRITSIAPERQMSTSDAGPAPLPSVSLSDMPDLGQGPPLFTPPNGSAGNVPDMDTLADIEVASTLMSLAERNVSMDDLSDIADVLSAKSGPLMHVHVNELTVCVNSWDENNNRKEVVPLSRPSRPIVREIPDDDETRQVTEL